MPKIQPLKPFLVLLYGYPGSGKTHFARQFCDNVLAAHVQADKIRGELFEQPRYDTQENSIVNSLSNYMIQEFLNNGVSVVYDVNAARGGQRKKLYDLAYACHAQPLLVWFQMDVDSAFLRNKKRDRRKSDDKFVRVLDRTSFEEVTNTMQNPRTSENYAVVSGKHLYSTQQSAVIAKMRALGIMSSDDLTSKVIKPGMINLIPSAPGRVDLSRRNIAIR